MARIDRREVGLLAGVAVVGLALATLAVALIEDLAGVTNASSVYLVAVVASAVLSGTLGAVITAVAAFLLYPADWQLDQGPLVGAPTVYRQRRRWMEQHLGMTFGPRASA